MKVQKGKGDSSMAASQPNSLHTHSNKLEDKNSNPPGEWRTIKLNAVGMRFINGVSNSYDAIFPTELEGIMAIDDFQYAMTRINNTLTAYWPCSTCFIGGYACSICTLGLSFLLPSICIQDSERYLKRLLREYNCSRRFSDRSITWTLQKRCLNSWIEIKYFYKERYSYLANNRMSNDSLNNYSINHMNANKEEMKEEKIHNIVDKEEDPTKIIHNFSSNEGLQNLIMERGNSQETCSSNETSCVSKNSLILHNSAESSNYHQGDITTATL